MKLAADPAATAAYYKPWSGKLTADMLAAKPEPISAEFGVRCGHNWHMRGRSSDRLRFLIDF